MNAGEKTSTGAWGVNILEEGKQDAFSAARLSCTRSAGWLCVKADFHSQGPPFPGCLLLENQIGLISGRETTTDPDQQQRCLSCYSNEMGCRCHSWAGNGYLGVQPASQEVQESLGVAWMGAVTSPSSTSQAAGQQGWVLPASEYGELFS